MSKNQGERHPSFRIPHSEFRIRSIRNPQFTIRNRIIPHSINPQSKIRNPQSNQSAIVSFRIPHSPFRIRINPQ
ncbi:MAG TPA: hypothetical protein VGQ81_15155 [Acidobacteriota bacterium]|jgi:hypothetical protein|nr:hypothetical protein [Acidobacteriota bacterium]